MSASRTRALRRGPIRPAARVGPHLPYGEGERRSTRRLETSPRRRGSSRCPLTPAYATRPATQPSGARGPSMRASSKGEFFERDFRSALSYVYSYSCCLSGSKQDEVGGSAAGEGGPAAARGWSAGREVIAADNAGSAIRLRGGGAARRQQSSRCRGAPFALPTKGGQALGLDVLGVVVGEDRRRPRPSTSASINRLAVGLRAQRRREALEEGAIAADVVLG